MNAQLATQERPARLTSDAAVRGATGRDFEEWFAVLDAWGATARRHGEIAASMESAKAYWRERLGALKALLEAPDA